MIQLYKKLFFGLLFLVLTFFAYQYFTDKENTTMEYNSNLIQEQIKSVGKLVVTEGHYSQILTFKDEDRYLGGLISFDKKALVVVNSDVTVAYDLRQMKYEINEKAKVIRIISIPKEEIKISPDIQYYDIEQSKFNEFTGADFNAITKKVKIDLTKKIQKSTLKSNAQNRLISELSKILLVTHSIGWKVEYNGGEVKTEADFKL
ncbi:DUF4230 domain-containing protein [Flavobacterium columnare NBRC 100251 = ATCC 23463]|uniref:DUF4230 domain-containing protein n=2 Tax=Flavobacterium columnare TaxID=996 RepID=G8X699_FLACA|nr:DUF4230 domain-containing protein [Flavobacterium columnare]AEW86940.1 hypothetical protein FCOL_10685 [Flavobacterium columnare ATCC 49512]PDS25321.1 DUF4230 domain-containing protein [Flavobacterium columnare NBRC 100251 = ATCC 23463]AMO21284.1 DUF4230 domain-containing protein [Flavobacterium columnare]ANO47743.1 hypothetical protein Pf1_02288 [Flavobacterium columnare]APT21645.1 hypothetical protein BU993_02740 [Flavobacterium columnare]